MNKLKVLILISTLSFSTLLADGMKCGAEKCGSGTKSITDSKNLSDMKQVDGYKLKLSSKKPLVVGENKIFVKLQKGDKVITDVKMKIKFFMPQMPGMPYMEYKEKLKPDANVYKGSVNFTMGGTWQYQLKFKDSDDKIHKIRGSVNL